MLNFEQAQSIAIASVAEIARSAGTELQLLEDQTIERPFGWVFFYNSQQFLETQDLKYALAGNGPLIVDKRDARVLQLGTAYPVDEYIEHYEKTDEVL